MQVINLVLAWPCLIMEGDQSQQRGGDQPNPPMDFQISAVLCRHGSRTSPPLHVCCDRRHFALPLNFPPAPAKRHQHHQWWSQLSLLLLPFLFILRSFTSSILLSHAHKSVHLSASPHLSIQNTKRREKSNQYL